jgi:hypothetical protein
MKYTQLRLGKAVLHFGPYKTGIHLGIAIDKYGFDFSLGLFFIGMEW